MSQVDINTNVNSVNVQNTINTVDVNQEYSNVLVIPEVITNIVEVVSPGPQGPPGDPSIFTGSYVLTSSFNAFTASYNTGSFTGSFGGVFTGSFTGSFFGDGGGLTNISASSVVGLNLSQIASGSFTASISPNFGFVVNTSSSISGDVAVTGSIRSTSNIYANKFVFQDGVIDANSTGQNMFGTNNNTFFLYPGNNGLVFKNQGDTNVLGVLTNTGNLSMSGGFTGSLLGTASFAISASHAPNALTSSFAISASYAATASSADNFIVRQNITASNAFITGTLTVQTIVAQVITSSTEYITGSTIFGSSLSDTHQFTGSVLITGSLINANSSLTGSFSGSFFGDGGGLTNISASSVIGLNLSQIASGSATASISPTEGFRVNTNTIITGSITGYAFTNPQTITSSINIPASHNALMLGPVAIQDTLQVGSGSNLIVLESLGNLATTSSNIFRGDQTIIGDLYVSSSQISYQNNNNVNTGTSVIAEVDKVIYTGAFFDYVISKGSDFRAGTVTAVWNATSNAINANDVVGASLGNTSGVTFSTAIVSGNLQLLAVASSNGWTIKMLVRAL